MPRHDHECRGCGKVFEQVVCWDDKLVICSCGQTADRVYRKNSPSVQDDTLTGGARWMHNLGHDPVWVETKTQLRNEMSARGLVPAERNVYRRDDKTAWATRTRLRPGARDDAMPDIGQ